MAFDLKKHITVNKLGWGVLLLFFGILALLFKLDFPTADCVIYSPKFWFIYAGVILVFTRNLGAGALSLLIAALINFGYVASTFKEYKDFVIPVALIVVGAVILFYNKTGK